MKNANDCMRLSIEGSDMEHFDFDSCMDEWAKLRN